MLIIYALGTLIRISATTSGAVIATSKHYRMLALFIGSQILYTVALHYLFIPLYGITGAAISVLLTYLLRTILIVGFIRIKMKMFCYHVKHIWVLLIAAIAFIAGYLAPSANSLIINIVLKSVVTSLIFIVFIIGLKISPEMTKLYHTALKKFRA
ncbi:MAG: polysaccharide biosynthesis C-terminal domain-containing protein [bacterium]